MILYSGPVPASDRTFGPVEGTAVRTTPATRTSRPVPLARAALAVALCLAPCAPGVARAATRDVPAPATAAAESAADAGAERAARRAAGAAAAPGRDGDRLRFGPCPAVERLPDPVECATLRVPLDYARPGGPLIPLTVSRARATGARGAARQGALVHNPGGPGASGMYFPLVAGLAGWERISAAYDLVGYAPRGVGRSAPLSCQDPAVRAQGPTQVPVRPSAAYKRQRVEAARAYGRGCAERAGAALAQYTTLNNVRDLHVLRAALGERKLNFLGSSYGTYLGAVYAARHPDRVRRMVLDSAVDPDPGRVWYRDNLAQGPAFERRWYDFRSWTARHHDVYGLGATPEAVGASYERVRAAVARTPAGGVVGTGELQAAYLQAAYYDDVWPERAAALAAFLRGDPDPLAGQAAPDPAAAPAAEAENAAAVYTAVLCNDAPWPADWETWDRDTTELARTAPFEAWANTFLNLPCAYWPVRDRQRPDPVGPPPAAGPRLPRTLVVAAERDGATPYRGALELQRRLGGEAALVTEEGSGSHGVVGGRNACVDRHVERYLLKGDTSGWRVTCAPHPEPAPVSLDDRAARARGALPPPVV
ncbi:alpha/beta fold hydrolase [Streptomyces subrutilus]|uniref:Alpha/beta fold hydrolase n=1 Tax=Streptomyces subrutilus TaxID=36818 RepID=A0A5P2UTY2_9ACTN|nr:alpha/beta fold hydrolase [Streptomyces subrutilus]